ncbi:MAG TPA: NADPH-dependent F420 reductase, partial [Egibacteraceae bacterium]|nr:NADPH-dependent F420 reductase [Egibacteraceae bacterium]
MNSDLPVLGFLGGTGPHGRGLGLRLGRAGHRVLIGSRDAARAHEVAAALSERVAGGKFEGLDNAGVCEAADVLLVTLPNDSVAGLLAGLSGAIGAKVVISCVNSLAFDERGPTVARAPDGSWAEECQRLLPDARVVSAFQNVSSAKLRAGEEPVRADVLVCGDDLGAKEIAMELARHIPG